MGYAWRAARLRVCIKMIETERSERSANNIPVTISGLLNTGRWSSEIGFWITVCSGIAIAPDGTRAARSGGCSLPNVTSAYYNHKTMPL